MVTIPGELKDDVIKQYNENKENRWWGVKARDSVLNAFRSEEKQQDLKLRDIRDAMVQVQKRQNDAPIIDDYEKQRKEFEDMKNNLLSEAEALTQKEKLGELDDNYRKRLSELQNKKVKFDEKVMLFGGAKNAVDDHLAKQAFVKLQRSPFSERFTNKANSDSFLNTYVKDTVYDAQNNYLLDTPEGMAKYGAVNSSLNTLFSIFEPDVMELVRRGEIDSPDKYYLTPEFQNMTKEVRKSVDELYKNNKEALVMSDGSFNAQEFNKLMRKDPKFKAALDSIEKTKEDLDKQITSLRRKDPSNWLEKLGGLGVQAVTFLTENVINEGLESLSSTIQGDPNISFFGDEQKRAFVEKAAGTDNFWKWAGRNALRNPGDIALVATELVGMLSPATAGTSGMFLGKRLANLGAFGAQLTRLDKGRQALAKATNLRRVNTGISTLDNLINPAIQTINIIKNRAPNVADEIIKSIPLDFFIDAWTQEYDMAPANTFFSGLPGVFFSGAKTAADKIIESLETFTTNAEKANYLRRTQMIPVDETMDLSNRNVVTGIVNDWLQVLAEPQGFTALVGLTRYVDDMIDTAVSDKGLEAFETLYRRVIPNILEGTNIPAPVFRDLSRQAVTILDDTTKTEVQKIGELQQLTKTRFNDLGVDYLQKGMNGKVKQQIQNNIVLGMAKVFQDELGLTAEQSMILSLQAFANKVSTPEQLIQAVVDSGAKDIPRIPDTVTEKIAEFNKINEFVDNSTDLIGDLARIELAKMGMRKGEAMAPATFEQKAVATPQERQILQPKAMEVTKKGQQFADNVDEILTIDASPEGKYLGLSQYIQNVGKYVQSPAKMRDLTASAGQLSNSSGKYFASKVGTTARSASYAEFSRNLVEYARTMTDSYSTDMVKMFVSGAKQRSIGTDTATLTMIFGEEFAKRARIAQREAGQVSDAMYEILFRQYVGYVAEKYLMAPEKYGDEISRVIANMDLPDDQAAFVMSWYEGVAEYLIENSNFVYNIVNLQGSKFLSAQGISNYIDVLELGKIAASEGLVGGLKAYKTVVNGKELYLVTDGANEYGFFTKAELKQVWGTTKKRAAVVTETATDDIAAEARKYKTADEFVKAQGEPMYHGTNKFDGDRFVLGKKPKNRSGNLEGIYLDSSRRIAEGYGDVIIRSVIDIQNTYKVGDDLPQQVVDEYLKKIKEKVPGLNDTYYSEKLEYFKKNALRDSILDGSARREVLMKGGYDSAIDGTNIIVFDPNNIKTEFQLREIREQANKVVDNVPTQSNTMNNIPDELLAEARKYNSAQKFLNDFLAKQTLKEFQQKKTAFVVPQPILNALKQLNRNALNRYQKTLLEGTGYGDMFYLPSLDDVVKDSYRHFLEGTDATPDGQYVIPFSYLTKDGLEILSPFFRGKEEEFYKLVQRSYKAQVDQISALGSTIVQKFYDGNNLKLIGETNKTQISLPDLLYTLAPRITEEAGTGLTGVVYAPMMVLSKYLIDSDQAYKAAYIRAMNIYFGQRGRKAPKTLNNYKRLIDTQGLVGDGMGDSLLKYYDDVKARIKELTGVEDAGTLSDIAHPLLYNADEYIAVIAEAIQKYDGLEYESIIDMIADSFLKRRSTESLIGFDKATKARNTIKELNLPGLPSLQAQVSLQNQALSAMENVLSINVVSDLSQVQLPIEQFRSFLYRSFGVGLYNEPHGFISDTLALYGSYLKTMAREAGATDQAIKEFEDVIVTLRSAQGLSLEGGLKLTKQFVRDNKLDGTEFSNKLQEYTNLIFDNDKSTARNILIDDMMKRFGTSDIIEPSQALDIGYVEKTQQAKEKLVAQIIDFQQTAYENVFTNVITDFVTRDMPAGMQINIDRLAAVLGMKRQRLQELMRGARLLKPGEEFNITALRPTEQIKILSELVEKGDINVSILLQNRVFRDRVRSIVADNPTGAQKNVWYTVDEQGNIILRENRQSSFLRTFFAAVLPINMRAMYDEEAKNIIAKWFTKSQTGVVSRPTSKFFQGQSGVGIKKYLYVVTDGIQEFITKNNISITDYKNVANQMFKVSPSVEKIGDKSFKVTTSLDTMDGLIASFATQDPKLGELAKMLSEYRVDINKFRGGDAIQFADKITEGKTLRDLMNRLKSGSWVYLSNDDMLRIEQKFAPKIGKSAASRMLLENFTVDTLFGGLFDTKTLVEQSSSWLSRLAMTLMYNPSQLGKGFQQLLNNKVHAQSILDGYKYNSDALMNLSNYIYDRLNYRMFDAKRFELVRGSSTGKLEKAEEIFDKAVTYSNVLYWSDSIVQTEATRAAMVQALYPLYEQGGQEAIDIFTRNVERYKAFSEKFGVKNERGFLNKYMMHKTIMNESATPIADKRLYDELYAFVNTQFEPFLSNTRIGLGTFYVMDNIRELGASRIIENNRGLFVFKKRALAKVGEYAHRFVEEFAKATATNPIEKLMEMPVLNMFFSDVARNLHFAWMAGRMTDQEMDIDNFVYNMSVPFVAFSMAIGDAFSQGYKAYSRAGNFDADGFSRVVIGAVTAARESVGTAFLYHDLIASKINTAINTGLAYDDIEDGLVSAVKGFFMSSYVDPITRMRYDQYRGIYMNTSLDGDWATNTAETLLNIKGMPRRQYEELIQNLYSSTDFVDGNLAGWFWDYMTRSLPIIGSARYNTTYLNPLLESLEDYTTKNKLDYLNNRFAASVDVVGTAGLIDTYEATAIQAKLTKEKPEYLKMIESGDITVDDMMAIAAKEGLVGPDLIMFTKVLSLMRYQSNSFAQGLAEGQTAGVTPETKAQLEQSFIKILKDNTKRYSVNIEKAVNDFFIATSDLGTNLAMADYLSAMGSASKKFVETQYYGTSVDDRQELFLDKKAPAYLGYIQKTRDLQKAILLQSWDTIFANHYIGQELKKDVLLNARDLPFNSDTGISTRTVISHIVALQDLQDTMRKEGHLTDNLMNKYNIIYKNNLEQIKMMKAENKGQAYRNIIKVFNMMNDNMDGVVGSKYDQSIIRMGLAYTMTPFFADIKKYDEAAFSELINALGEDFTRMSDIVTNSSPIDDKQALEMALDIPYNPGKGTGGGNKRTSYAAPKKRVEENALKFAKGINNMRETVYRAQASKGIQPTNPSSIKFSASAIPGFTQVEVSPIKVEMPKPIAAPRVVGTTAKTQPLGPTSRNVSRSKYSSRKVYRPKKIGRTYFANTQRGRI